MIKIEKIGPDDFETWDHFVEMMDEASFHHQIRWRKFIETMYGKWLTPIYLMARNGSEVEGILPLFVFCHWFFGKKLISVPFSSQAGCCARTDLAANSLIKKAIEITKELNLDYLELRNLYNYKMNELVTDKSYFTLKLDLENNFDTLQKKFRSTTRRYVRRSKENDLVFDMFSDNIEDFYKIYSIGQRNLGTPTQGYKWLKTLYSSFKENHSVVQVQYKGKLVAAILLRIYKDTVTYVIGSSLPEYRHLYSNYLLFGELLKYYCEKGYHYFDFGRSIENSGSYYFKRGWGAQPIQFYYQYHLEKTKKITSTSQVNPKRILFAKLWKRFPLSLSEILGPIIRRYYP
ncbi:MAG: GNAT family N-acetyltransferase [Candidatus Hodarchaeota archaeon]